MNETVRSEVEKLFENTVMNDETRALFDEVLNNCQERYDDLSARGLSQEECLAAVRESLKGMEEIVASYPRQQPEVLEKSAPPQSPDRFSTEGLARIIARLTDADVDIQTTDDSEITAEIRHAQNTQILVQREGDCLRISQRKVLFTPQENEAAANAGRSARMPWESVTNTINEAIRQLTQMAQRFSANVSFSVGEENLVRLRLPRDFCPCADLQSLSGDIRWNGAKAQALLLDSTSGDLEALLPPGDSLRLAQLKTASGDVQADLDAEDLTIQSMSGDIRWTGVAQRLTATSISGDVEVVGRFENGTLKTVSGDLEVTPDETVRQVRAVSTSGDITVQLPASVTQVQTRLTTVSGETEIRNLLNSDSAEIRIEASTVSGDVRIQRQKTL